jgi:two-component system OmpR family response regulator
LRINRNVVLVADDDRDMRDLLLHALESVGYETVAARDGQAAARILTVARPVALITDVLMAGMNGIDLCRLARQTSDTAILMISSNSHEYDIAAGMAAGADRYLPKPFTPRQVVAELQDVVTGRPAPAAVAQRHPGDRRHGGR